MKSVKVLMVILVVMCCVLNNNVFVYAQSNNVAQQENCQLDKNTKILSENYEKKIKQDWKYLWKEKDAKIEYSEEKNAYFATYSLEEKRLGVNDVDEEITAKTVLYAVASSGSKQEIDYDSVYTIKGYVTIYYTNLVIEGTSCQRLTKVAGGYTWLDGAGTKIVSQNVYYGMTGMGSSLYVNETDSKSPTTSSFSYPTGFKGAVNTEGPYALGATYTINLKRIASGSTWKLQIQCSY